MLKWHIDELIMYCWGNFLLSHIPATRRVNWRHQSTHLVSSVLSSYLFPIYPVSCWWINVASSVVVLCFLTSDTQVATCISVWLTDTSTWISVHHLKPTTQKTALLYITINYHNMNNVIFIIDHNVIICYF